MQIYNGTGVAAIACQLITKSMGTLVITSTKAFSALTNETITIQIQRVGAGNIYLATSIPLKDFIYANLCNREKPINTTIGQGNWAVIDLGLDANIQLRDGDKIAITLAGIVTTDTYIIDALEDVASTSGYYDYESKAIVAGETDKTLDVSGYDVAVITLDGSINEIGVTAVGTPEKRYTARELTLLQIDDDPFFSIGATGLVAAYDATALVLPLQYISSLRFFRTITGTTRITFMKVNELAPVVIGKPNGNVVGIKR